MSKVVIIEFRYRCRRCKVEYTESSMGGTKTGAILRALEAFHPKAAPWPQSPEMFALHSCFFKDAKHDHDEMGVADFVGYDTTPEGFKP